MMLEGVDYSSSRPGGAALAAAGKYFACRYVPYGGFSKGLNRAELDDLRAHGIAVALVWEQVTSRALQGAAAGTADALTSQAAVVSLGFPPTTPIYFAVDFAGTLAQQPAINQYLSGAASVIGKARVGVYGSYDVLNRCRANGTAAWFWQTYAWSGGAIASYAHLYQYHNGANVNGSVDLCRAMQANYGQWDAPGMTPPETSTGEEDMALGWKITTFEGGNLTIKGTGHSAIRLRDALYVAQPAGLARPYAAKIALDVQLPGGIAGADRRNGYLIGEDVCILLASDVTAVPTAAPAPQVPDVKHTVTLQIDGVTSFTKAV
jgi:Domain of unknown function (DUF1906)